MPRPLSAACVTQPVAFDLLLRERKLRWRHEPSLRVACRCDPGCRPHNAHDHEGGKDNPPAPAIEHGQPATETTSPDATQQGINNETRGDRCREHHQRVVSQRRRDIEPHETGHRSRHAAARTLKSETAAGRTDQRRICREAGHKCDGTHVHAARGKPRQGQRHSPPGLVRWRCLRELRHSCALRGSGERDRIDALRRPRLIRYCAGLEERIIPPSPSYRDHLVSLELQSSATIWHSG